MKVNKATAADTLLDVIIIALFFAFDRPSLVADALPSSTTIAFISSSWRPRPVQSRVQCGLSSSRQWQEVITSGTVKNSNDVRRVIIQKISLIDTDELERMSRFCIDAFYGQGEDKEGSLLSRICMHTLQNARKWKDVRLGAMRKAQLLDISLSPANKRCIFVAKDMAADKSDEIIGCCEVIEEKLDIMLMPISNITVSEQERRKTARLRPVIENLCIKQEYRRSGVGCALVHACEKAVQMWHGHDEIFAQVGDDDTGAFRLFRKRGFQFLFADPTCTEVVLDNTLIAKEIVVTKRMMIKFLQSLSTKS